MSTPAGVQTVRLRQLLEAFAPDDGSRLFAIFSAMLAESAAPELTLVGLERFVRAVPGRADLLSQLGTSPRAVEVLGKLFAGSPYLTDILLREPSLLSQMTQPQSMGDLRSRDEFFESALAAAKGTTSLETSWSAFKRYQQSELLRIGVCDFLGLLDLRSVTNQLSLLADALVQATLKLLRGERADESGFAILALGKLGGEELNYSSDIDLVFLCDGDSAPWQTLAQRMTRALSDATSAGFLYRVDLRLRPWGQAGPLVTPVATYSNYLRQEALLWEKQALLKARVIAGDFSLGEDFLEQCQPLLFPLATAAVRQSVWQAKQRIEQDLRRRGRGGGEVKLGAGTIRDVEFVVQCLQLQYGGAVKEVRSINTLDALVRLAELGFLRGEEFRELSSAYVFFRGIEHTLQLKHSRQTHTLPADAVELETLARRLDFLNAAQLIEYFQQHRSAVRHIFEKYVRDEAEPHHEIAAPRSAPETETTDSDKSSVLALTDFPQLSRMPKSYRRSLTHELAERHADLLSRLSEEEPLIVDWRPHCDDQRDSASGEVTIVGFDQLGDLSMICGLLFVHGFDIVQGLVTTEEIVSQTATRLHAPLRFLNTFVVRLRQQSQPSERQHWLELWSQFRNELIELLKIARAGRRDEAQGRLARRVSEALPPVRPRGALAMPVEIEFDNDLHPHTTLLRIGAQDTSGFLYELTNALALLGIDIRQMEIRTEGSRVRDTLQVIDESGRKLLEARQQQELRAAIVLIQHFTDLLPDSPDPEAALLHFRQLLQSELRQADWLERLASLQRPGVLAALAKLLGVSDLFWEDFLRLQHTNLFPVLTDVAGLGHRKSLEELHAELHAELTAELSAATSHQAKRERLNAFKDREMFRVDMRHIVGVVPDFVAFSAELSELAEVVLIAACDLVIEPLRTKHGAPCRWCVAALGKLGGSEIGFASDIELLFLYEADGATSGPQAISHAEFFQRFVEQFQNTIVSQRAGIFQIDLRLRPHGRAGNLAVSLDEFCRYFAANGAAWPFERQSLIKLRPIAGDESFGREVIARRDELLFVEAAWDPIPVRAMRERQVRQLVKAGTFHAKLSPGALVDVEYLVQLLQLTHGRKQSAVRDPNMLSALSALKNQRLIPDDAAEQLRSAYLFFRRLIDALRMAHGSADDLTLPTADSAELSDLARRLACPTVELLSRVEREADAVRAWAWALGWPIVPT